MGRAPCCDKANVKRGPWSPEEDATLKNYLQAHGTGGNWIALPRKAGLRRCGKSCRLRWLNYLRPDIKHGGFTEDEDRIICNLYNQIGSRWSVIASQLPGRTDNDVKNYWNTKLKKKLLAGKINLNMTNTNGTSSTNAHLIPTNNATVLPASKTPSPLLDQPPNSRVPKIETFDSSFLNSSETQNSAASLRTLTGFDSPGLLTQYDLNPFCTNNSRLVDFSAVSLSQEGGSSNINNADINLASVPPHNGCDGYIRGHHGSALMDFGYGFPYDVMDDVSFEEKAYCHDQVAPTCSISISDLGCVEIRPPAGLNQSTIINNY